MIANLAVVILTYNEARHIERAILSVRPIAASIFVIDSGSTDETVDIARRQGAEILYHKFKNQADQFQWALGRLPATAEWILRLDADEVIEPDLATYIDQNLTQLPAEVSAVNFDRKHIFMGRWIRHGGRYPLRLLRLFRAGHAHVEQRWMDEHIVLDRGKATTFPGGFADHNLMDLTYFTNKHNAYATREAVEVLNKRYALWQDTPGVAGSTQAAVRRWVKDDLYYRLPFGIAALGYFLYRYVIRLGFLDGPQGLIYHFLQGCWYRFLVGAKVVEFEKGLRAFPDKATKRRELARLSGLELE